MAERIKKLFEKRFTKIPTIFKPKFLFFRIFHVYYWIRENDIIQNISYNPNHIMFFWHIVLLNNNLYTIDTSVFASKCIIFVLIIHQLTEIMHKIPKYRSFDFLDTTFLYIFLEYRYVYLKYESIVTHGSRIYVLATVNLSFTIGCKLKTKIYI